MASGVIGALRGARPAVLSSIIKAMEEIAPPALAGSWYGLGGASKRGGGSHGSVGDRRLLATHRRDNVGLLVDTWRTELPSPCVVFVTNDLTERVLLEATRKRANVIVTYHPTPFSATRTLVRRDAASRIALACAAEGIAVYSPHTALDTAPDGMTDWLVRGCGEGRVVPIKPSALVEGAGEGRLLELAEPAPLSEVIARVKRHLGLEHVRVSLAAGALDADAAPTSASVMEAASRLSVRTVAACPGSGVSVLGGVAADVFLTGEFSHHGCLAASVAGTSVLLTDHSNSERGFLPELARRIEAKLGDADVRVLVSDVDADPLFVV